MRRVLVARTDGLGDVLLTGPAVRAVAASSALVTMLVGRGAAPAAHRLPGVRDVECARLPWIDAEPQPVSRAAFDALVAKIERGRYDEAIIFTSFHQSALPLALACRLARVPRVVAISDDYPGSLLDVRHHVPDDIHEVERNLSLVRAAGYEPPPGDDTRLALTLTLTGSRRRDGFVAVHPGASVPARTLAPRRWRAVVAALASNGTRVVVTGAVSDTALTRFVSHDMPATVSDCGGTTDFDAMATLLARADAVVVGNTGPAHIAAAVGTPVVSVFAPTVPAVRWHPWMVPHVLLGDHEISCRDCRSRACPYVNQPCLASVTPADVVEAVAQLHPTPAVTV
jgi:ADP-heptose:LPS heptosyltransferase